MSARGKRSTIRQVLWLIFSRSDTLHLILLAGTGMLLSPNITSVADDFGFDEQARDVKLGGRMKLLFYGSGVLPCIAFGLLADVQELGACRKLIVPLASLVSQMSTLAVWFLPSGNAYFRLLCLQCVCGAATGAAAAAGTGLMAGKIEGAGLSFASAMGGVLYGIGQGIGLFVAGRYGHGHKKGWKYPFLLYGGAGTALALMLLLVRICPCKQDQDMMKRKRRASSFRVPTLWRERRGSGRFCHFFWCTSSVPILCVSILICSVPGGLIDTFWTDFLALLFFTESTALCSDDYCYDNAWNLAINQATDLQIVGNLGAAAGQLTGGLIGVCFAFAQITNPSYNPKALSKSKVQSKQFSDLTEDELAKIPRCSKLLFALMILTCLFTPLPFGRILIFAPSAKMESYFKNYVLPSLAGGFLRGVNEPLVKAAVLGLTPPDILGAGAAILTAFIIFGKACGPSIVTALIYRKGRGEASIYSFFMWPCAGILLLGLCCTGDKDARFAARDKLLFLRAVKSEKDVKGSKATIKKKANGLNGDEWNYEMLEMGDSSEGAKMDSSTEFAKKVDIVPKKKATNAKAPGSTI